MLHVYIPRMKSNEQQSVREIDLEYAKQMVKAQATEVWQACPHI